MKVITASELAQALNRIDIMCEAVIEGDCQTLEHGEVSITYGRKALTVFVSPVNDTMYLGVWQSKSACYKLSDTYHYAGQFHQLLRAIRKARSHGTRLPRS